MIVNVVFIRIQLNWYVYQVYNTAINKTLIDIIIPLVFYNTWCRW